MFFFPRTIKDRLNTTASLHSEIQKYIWSHEAGDAALGTTALQKQKLPKYC